MKKTKILRKAFTTVGMPFVLALSVPPAWAGYTVTLQQVGPNVVATGSGALDLTGLTFVGSIIEPAYMTPSAGLIETGPAEMGSIADEYLGASGASNFGSGNFTPATDGSGDIVGVFIARIFVPQGYISGSALSDNATYDNQTLSSLGVTPGTYQWWWGTGQDQNFTLVAVAVFTPTPTPTATATPAVTVTPTATPKVTPRPRPTPWPRP